MRHLLVVANETLVGAHLTRRLHELNEAEPLDVFVVVPIKARDDSRGIDQAIETSAAPSSSRGRT